MHRRICPDPLTEYTGGLIVVWTTRMHPMALHSGTSRVLLALYLAFGVPLCCCGISVAAACCSPASPPDTTVSRSASDHAHDGHHHDHGHHHGDQAPRDDQAPNPTPPCDDDDSCNCGCDTVELLLVKTWITIDNPVLAGTPVRRMSPATTAYRSGVRPLVIGASSPPTSLLRMHCALTI